MLSSDSILHKITKHIEVNIHFIRKKVRSAVITPSFVSSSTQIVDMFPKSIGPSLLKSSLVKLGLIDFLPQLDGSVGIGRFVFLIRLGNFLLFSNL